MTTRQDECSSASEDNDLECGIAPQPASFSASSSLDLMSDEARDTYLKVRLPLYQAAFKGDWDTARGILEEFPDAIRARITNDGDLALHVAVVAKHTKFVIELVRNMTDEDLALPAKDGGTALYYAAMSGNVEIAKVLMKRNPNLIKIPDNKGILPLKNATFLGHKDMTWCLYRATNYNDLTPNDRIELLVNMIDTDLYDVALDMLQNHPELATARDANEETALHALARKPLKASTFDNQSQKGVWWTRCTKFCVDVVDKEIRMHPKALELVKRLWKQMILSDNIPNLIEHPREILFVAAELGNVDFLLALFRLHPELIYKVDREYRSIFHIAILHRQENIFSLINEIGAIKDVIATFKDRRRNNMLHLAGMLAPRSRLNILSGPAFQMQRELLWFKEVEKVVPPLYVEARNADGHTPRALFSLMHEELMKQGETWMKETAGSCMLVATLVATMMFAATITLPGGNNNDTGIPIYRKTAAFKLFWISNTIGLLFSSTSILFFLSIFTSRYAEDDFLVSLPKKLINGIATLYISVAAMMVVFGSTFVIDFYQGLESASICIACTPVILTVFVQYQILFDIIKSILRSYKIRLLYFPTKHYLFRES